MVELGSGSITSGDCFTNRLAFREFWFHGNECLIVNQKDCLLKVKLPSTNTSLPVLLQNTDRRAIHAEFVVEEQPFMELEYGKMIVIGIRKRSLWCILKCEHQIRSISLDSNPIGYTLGQQIHETNLTMLTTHADIVLPEDDDCHNVTKQSIWGSCFSPDQKTLLFLYSNLKVAWLYAYVFANESSEQPTLRTQKPILVTQRSSYDVLYLNSFQAIVQHARGFCIVHLDSGMLCFKFNFINYLTVNLTVSKFAIAVPRIKKGLIVKMGCLR